MIDHAIIERILDASEIVEVVSDFVTLKRRGVNYLGLCPFHNEKTPSFSVSPSRGIYKCFGCGKGGNPVNFIMEHESLTYPEALKWLAKKYNIEVVEKEETDEEKQLKDERESMLIVTGFAGKYFSRYLWSEEEGRAIGLSYFRERGLRDDSIKKFELGYCPEGKSKFTEAAQREGYRLEFLEKTGLTIMRDDWVRDRFSGRVIFPIQNIAGNIIGFGGRILKDEKEAAKYLNSPESEIYHKSKIVYGIFQAKKEIARSDKCYLVEGYTDVLSMHQSGIENVVASSGTALTVEQIRLIRRFTQNITIIYDGDEAGIKASLRGIDLVLEEGMNVKVLLLPDGEDPDSFARKHNSSELLEFIGKNETDFIQFKTRLLLKTTENDPVARARLISDVIRSVAVIPDNITRSVYIRECSKLLSVDEAILYTEVRKQKRKKEDEIRKLAIREEQKQSRTQSPFSQPETGELTTEETELLRFLLKFSKALLFEEEGEHPMDIRTILAGEYIRDELERDGLIPEKPLFRIIFEEVADNLENPDFDPWKHFVYHPDGEVSKLATNLLSEKYEESRRWKKAGAFTEKEEDLLPLLIPRIVNEFKLKKLKKLLKGLENDIRKASAGNDFEKVIELQTTYINLKSIEKHLSDQLGNRTII